MCERWRLNKMTAWAAGSDEIDALPDCVRAVDRDDRACLLVLCEGMDDGGHRWTNASRIGTGRTRLDLGEMRMLLKAVHGVVTGLAGQGQEADRAQMEQAARSAGMHMAEDVNPTLMAKLPLPFKQMGMSIHKDMDGLADAIVQKETPQQILQRLSNMTARCTTCHDMYRFSTKR